MYQFALVLSSFTRSLRGAFVTLLIKMLMVKPTFLLFIFLIRVYFLFFKQGSAYDAEDNASFSRSCLPLQPLGQVRIHVARFLCHLLFHCRGEDGAEIVERIAELDFVGDLTVSISARFY